MKTFSEKSLKRQLKHLDLIHQSLNTMSELISNWSQWNDKKKEEFLTKGRDEIRERLNEEPEKKL